MVNHKSSYNRSYTRSYNAYYRSYNHRQLMTNTLADAYMVGHQAKTRESRFASG